MKPPTKKETIEVNPVLNGTYFSIIKLPSDKAAATFSTQRIVQIVVDDGRLPVTFVTENDYIKPEMEAWFQKLLTRSYEKSLAGQGMILGPVKLTLHWRKLTETGLSKERFNPETGEKCE